MPLSTDEIFNLLTPNLILEIAEDQMSAQLRMKAFTLPPDPISEAPADKIEGASAQTLDKKAKDISPQTEAVKSPLPKHPTAAAPNNSRPSPHVLTAEEIESLVEKCWERAETLIREKQINTGIIVSDGKQMLRIWLEKQKEKQVEIAKGIHPQNGKDARVEILFEKKVPVDPLGKQTINLRERDYVTNLKAKTPLIRWIAPTSGVNGKNIKGKTLPAKAGQEKKVRLHPFVEELKVSPEEIVYVTSIDCMLEKLDATQIVLSNLLKMNHDINYETGNIHVFGSLQLHGTINPHFMAQATHDVQVTGNVESAHVESDQNIKVEGGIFGSVGPTQAKSGGNLEARFVQNAKIHAEKDIRIKDSVVNSELICKGNIEVTERRGAVLTSCLVAGGTIQANVVGSLGEGRVVITAGYDPKRWQSVLRMEREFRFLKRTSMKGFMQFSANRKSNRIQNKIHGRIVDRQRSGIILEQVMKRRKRNILLELTAQNILPTFTVHKKIFPNAKISLGLYQYRVTEELPSGIFSPDANAGVVRWNRK